MRDCRLCDDLCYVTEPWVQCQLCLGSGRRGHLGDLAPDCTACNGVGFVKPGMGMGMGMPMYGGAPVMAGPVVYPSQVPPMGGYGIGPTYIPPSY